jgi:hypothetical protein
LIKIGYVRNLTTLFKLKTESSSDPSITELCKISNIYNDGILRDQTAHIISYIRGYVDLNAEKNTKRSIKNNEDKLEAGTIPVYGEGAKAKRSIIDSSNRIDIVLRGKDRLYKKIVYIPLSRNRYIRNNQSLLTYSIYLLLATIGEILKRRGIASEDSILSDMNELSQLRAFFMPDFKKAITDEENKSEDNESEDNESESSDENNKVATQLEVRFIESLSAWVKDGDRLTLNPHVLGKIATRLFYSIDNIETSYTNKKSLGEVFHAQIAALMNAVLIEDVRENFSSETINMNNPRYSNRILINNIKSRLADSEKGIQLLNKEESTFSVWFLKCPLLTCYLNLEVHPKIKKVTEIKDLYTALKYYCFEGLQEIDTSFSVYRILASINVRRNDSNNKASGRSLSLGVSGDYADIIEIIKTRDIPFNYFINRQSIGAKRIANSHIMAKLQDIRNVTVNTIRDFRKYLATENITWQ